MAKFTTFKRNRLAAAVGLAAVAIFVGTAPAQAQGMSSSGTSSGATGQYDQGASGAANSSNPNSGNLSQPGSASSSAQQGAMQSSGSSGTAGTGAASSPSDLGSSGASGTTGMSNSSGTSPGSRDMSGGTAVSGTSSTGITPGSSGSDNTAGASAATGNTQAGATNYTQANLSSSDSTLVKQLAQDNMAELQLAQLAQNKSTNDQVRNFAQQMIDDHTKAANELQQLAQAKNVTLPQALDSKHRAEEQKLGKLSGDQFDRQYLARAGTSDHSKVHSLLQKIARSAKDQDLRQLALNLQPEINKHLQMAQAARRNLAGATSTGSSSTSGSTSSGAGNPAAGGSSNESQQQNSAPPSSGQDSGSSTSSGGSMK